MTSPNRNSPTPGTSFIPPEGVKIIQELFQDYNELGYKQAVSELDAALEAKFPTVVIEPVRLGDETARWITIGNGLHKGAVIGSLTASCLGLVFPDKWLLYTPVCGVSLFCYLFYTVSWQTDPCVAYQLERNPSRLARLNLNGSSQQAVVLTHRDDTRRRILHSSCAIIAAGVVGFNLYRIFR